MPAHARAAHVQRAWRRFGPWVRGWGVQDGDTLGLELHGGDPCRMRMHVRPIKSATSLCKPALELHKQPVTHAARECRCAAA